MLQKEFEERVQFQVTDQEFKSINDQYMKTDLDKDQFCLLYKTSPALAKHVSDVTSEKKQLSDENKDLGYFLADQYQKLKAEDLRKKAVQILGKRAYLLYIIQNGYDITDSDKDIILDLI